MIRGRRAGLRAAGAVAAALALLASAPAAAAAQVGHPPADSPFRDVTTRQHLSLLVGSFGGNTAVAGVGWRAGTLVTGRLETRLGGALDFAVSLAVAGSSRIKIDTYADSAARVSGPFDRSLLLADLGLALNLTGAKTWRGLAPYVGLNAGWMTPTKGERDPGGYNAGANFTFAPSVGVRYRVSRGLALRLEARDYIWRYEWPLYYYQPVDHNGASITPAIIAASVSSRQRVHNLTLSAGLVYGFNF